MAIIAAIVVGITYGSILVLMAFTQEKYIFFPQEIVDKNPGLVNLDYESITIDRQSNTALTGWYIPADSADFTMLFCHGNSGNISTNLEMIKVFHDLYFNVLIFDYRGFGNSIGEITERGIYYDAVRAWEYLRLTRGIPQDKIILYGKSIGGAVAGYLAAGHHPAALILDSAFISVTELGRELYPFLPARWLTRYKFNTLEYIRRVSCPTLVIHSLDDSVIPVYHGQAIFKAAPEQSSFLAITGSHHTGFLMSLSRFQSGIENFMTLYLRNPSP